MCVLFARSDEYERFWRLPSSTSTSLFWRPPSYMPLISFAGRRNTVETTEQVRCARTFNSFRLRAIMSTNTNNIMPYELFTSADTIELDLFFVMSEFHSLHAYHLRFIAPRTFHDINCGMMDVPCNHGLANLALGCISYIITSLQSSVAPKLNVQYEFLCVINRRVARLEEL